MFNILKNQAILTFDIVIESSLFVKSGQDNSLNPSASDSTYIKTYRNGKYEPFIPGTSLKGVFRSRAERILRNNGACDIVNRKVCLDDKTADKEKLNGKERYQKSCPVCKLFGSMALKSRISFSDAYVNGSYKVNNRTCVGIDRITGASKTGALYNIEYVEDGIFEEKITIENFEPWHIKLIMHLIEDMNEGFLTLGSLSSKGFGKVRAENLTLTLKYYGQDLTTRDYINNGLYSEKTLNGYDEILEALKKVNFNNARKDGDIDEKAI
mgnify:CR=1 FL=1